MVLINKMGVFCIDVMSDSVYAIQPLKHGLFFKVFDPHNDIDALFQLMQQAPKFSLLCERRLATRADAQESLLELPPNTPRESKLMGGYWFNDQLIGCIDLIKSYPEPNVAFLGLLMFAESMQGKGLGAHALAHVYQIAQSWQCSQLRLAVIERNEPAMKFWQRHGFREIYRKQNRRYTSDVVVMQRAVVKVQG